jgi:hypothetical protein
MISLCYCEQIRVIDKGRLITRLGELSEEKMREVNEALRTWTFDRQGEVIDLATAPVGRFDCHWIFGHFGFDALLDAQIASAVAAGSG